MTTAYLFGPTLGETPGEYMLRITDRLDDSVCSRHDRNYGKEGGTDQWQADRMKYIHAERELIETMDALGRTACQSGICLGQFKESYKCR